MNDSDPSFDVGECTQIDEPEIGQTRSHQQTEEPFGVGEVAFVDVKATAFLVRKECLDMKPFTIPLTGLISKFQIAHQVDRPGGILPGDGERATTVEHTEHERDTAASDGTAVEDKHQRAMGQAGQEQPGT